MPQPFVVAQARDVDAGLVGGFHDCLAFPGRDLDAVDGEGKTAHLLKSLSKIWLRRLASLRAPSMADWMSNVSRMPSLLGLTIAE